MGFTTGDIEELERQVTIAAAGATQIAVTPDSGFAVWEDRDGAALWIQVAERAIVGARPFFAPAVRHAARVEAAVPEPEHPLDGGARLFILPEEKTILAVDVLNFPLVARALRPQAEVTVRLAAFAESLRFYATPADYEAEHAEARRQGVRWIVPTGLYPRDKGGTGRATAAITGIVRHAEERVNTLTASPFLHLRLETVGMTVDAVAASAAVPAEGAIAHGHFWLAAVAEPAGPGSLLRLAA